RGAIGFRDGDTFGDTCTYTVQPQPQGNLPNLAIRQIERSGARDRTRTGTVLSNRRILSPLRLPIPPPRHQRGIKKILETRVFLDSNTYSIFRRSVSTQTVKEGARQICWS